MARDQYAVAQQMTGTRPCFRDASVVALPELAWIVWLGVPVPDLHELARSAPS